jgi:hypothetical protein
MKKAALIFIGVLSAGGLMTACASHPDVRPGADGVHRVAFSCEDSDAGARKAIREANNYCEEFKKQAVFVDENKKYVGNVDESTYKTAKSVGRVAKTVGGTVWTFGAPKESNAGGVVGMGGVAVDAALGNGYEVDMRFKCQ